jgi:hypothetical protein
MKRTAGTAFAPSSDGAKQRHLILHPIVPVPVEQPMAAYYQQKPLHVRVPNRSNSKARCLAELNFHFATPKGQKPIFLCQKSATIRADVRGSILHRETTELSWATLNQSGSG